MTDTDGVINKIYVQLQNNGYLVLDKDYLWDGCDTPILDPSIEMKPVTVLKLTERVCDLNLDWPEKAEAGKLKRLSKQLRDSADLVDATIIEMLKQAKV